MHFCSKPILSPSWSECFPPDKAPQKSESHCPSRNRTNSASCCGLFLGNDVQEWTDGRADERERTDANLLSLVRSFAAVVTDSQGMKFRKRPSSLPDDDDDDDDDDDRQTDSHSRSVAVGRSVGRSVLLFVETKTLRFCRRFPLLSLSLFISCWARSTV